MNARLAAKLKTLPNRPGVYFHKSAQGEIIYVGKAAILKNRVRQYFQESRLRDVKTTALVGEIDDTDWVETESEVDALFLESEMVKRYMPRYNVLLRDDKSQSFVRIDMKSEWPVVSFTRGPLDDGADYFGPFYNGFALKKALRYLRRIYPYFVKTPDMKGSKLEMQIGLNPNMQEGTTAYKTNLRKLISYIKGNRKQLARELEVDMKAAAKAQEFERAANLRNKLRAMQELQQRVMFGDREFLDISKDRALADLADILGLVEVPKRIEGYDISHQGGQNVVASMVVFTNGASDRAAYRKFKMSHQTNNDVAQMYETIYRRLSEKNLKSWGRPDLIIIDGGKPQLMAALSAATAQGAVIPILGIAKREEEIIVHRDQSHVEIKKILHENIKGVNVMPDGEFYVINLHAGQRNLGSHTKNLRGETTTSEYTDIVKLFQRVRDEAHRFAVSYHTVLKRQRQTSGVLDDITGIGPASKRALMKKFGSVRQIADASLAEIEQVIGASKAQRVYDHLNTRSE